MARILFVEDEQDHLDILKRYFEKESFEVYCARCRSEALDILHRTPPHIVILDIMLNEGPEPEYDGFQVFQALQDDDYHGAAIALTALASEEDKLHMFELGVDDYVTKPFSMKELHYRIDAVLRRTGGARSIYRFGTAEVDLDNFVIRHPAGDENLSKREGELLRYLIEHKGRVLPRQELLTEIWRYAPSVTTRTVDTHILNVRKKLHDDANQPRFIETMHGVGYRFVADEG